MPQPPILCTAKALCFHLYRLKCVCSYVRLRMRVRSQWWYSLIGVLLTYSSFGTDGNQKETDRSKFYFKTADKPQGDDSLVCASIL